MLLELNENVLKSLKQFGVVAVGPYLLRLNPESGEIESILLPPDMWVPIPANVEQWEEGLHWTTGLEELEAVFLRGILPPNSAFLFLAMEKMEYEFLITSQLENNDNNATRLTLPVNGVVYVTINSDLHFHQPE